MSTDILLAIFCWICVIGMGVILATFSAGGIVILISEIKDLRGNK